MNDHMKHIIPAILFLFSLNESQAQRTYRWNDGGISFDCQHTLTVDTEDWEDYEWYLDNTNADGGLSFYFVQFALDEFGVVTLSESDMDQLLDEFLAESPFDTSEGQRKIENLNDKLIATMSFLSDPGATYAGSDDYRKIYNISAVIYPKGSSYVYFIEAETDKIGLNHGYLQEVLKTVKKK